jgi:hypothetical protein
MRRGNGQVHMKCSKDTIYRRVIRIPPSMIFLAFIFLGAVTVFARSSDEKAVQNFLELQRLHTEWGENVFGKGPYYRRVLYYYLVDKIGEEIMTDYNYLLISPESIYRREVRCTLSYGRWLEIVGVIDVESVKRIIGDDIQALKRWWRSRRLLAIRGRIVRFRIADDEWGKRVILHLKNIRLEELSSSPPQ